MKNIKLFETYFNLNEGKKDDFLASFKDINENTKEELWNIDPSPTKKFVNKLAKFFLEGYDVRVLESLITIYNDLVNKNQIDIKDINQFKTFQDFEDATLFANSKTSKNSLKKEIKKETENHDIVFENDLCTVYRIFSHKSSCILGKGTKWCITMSNTDHYWNHYNKNLNLDFYFVIMKPASKVLAKYKKMAVGVNINNEPYEVRDIFDKNMTLEKVVEISQAPIELFINTFNNPPINKEDLKTKLLKIGVEDAYIKDDFTVVSKNNVELKNLNKLPFSFSKIEGDLKIEKCLFTDYSFLPKEVTGKFIIINTEFLVEEINIPNCSNLFIEVKNLKGFSNNYDIKNDIKFKNINTEDLTTFNLPEQVNGSLLITEGTLKSLKGSPLTIKKDFIVYGNKIESLEYSPKTIGGTFDFSYNKVSSLEFLPENIGKIMNKGNRIG